jgi:serine/threonine protein kinase
MERCDGDLDNYIRGELPNISQESVNKKSILFQVVAGLSYLHHLGIIHRDLKPQNIFLQRIPRTKTVVAKLGDFGISKKRHATSSAFSDTGHYGTEDYIAPEVRIASNAFESVKPDVKSDVWALGITLFNLLTDGQNPYGEAVGLNYGVSRRTVLAEHSDLPLNIQAISSIPCAVHLFSKLLRNQPTHRPNAVEILYHPYFALTNNATKIFFAKLLKDLKEPHPSTLIIILDLPQICAWYERQTKCDEHEKNLQNMAKILDRLVGLPLHYLAFKIAKSSANQYLFLRILIQTEIWLTIS